ncbi:DUF202 domain-containing protein [Pseudarthrobacter sp. NPDC080039]|uniref:DUF202 domain-containing protein n=1 Tax=unclassified Pseudarthrobacter TaxID=2647000 RepID=UPI00344BEEDB
MRDELRIVVASARRRNRLRPTPAPLCHNLGRVRDFCRKILRPSALLAWIRTSPAVIARGVPIEAFMPDFFSSELRKTASVLLLALALLVGLRLRGHVGHGITRPCGAAPGPLPERRRGAEMPLPRDPVLEGRIN